MDVGLKINIQDKIMSNKNISNIDNIKLIKIIKILKFLLTITDVEVIHSSLESIVDMLEEDIN